jgi:hypothetical protein
MRYGAIPLWLVGAVPGGDLRERLISACPSGDFSFKTKQ